MPDSLVADLESEMACEDLLDCVYGLAAVDERTFLTLVDDGGALTVDELADRLDCGRTTAYRSVQRLLEAEVVRREQVNYDDGGYHYVYRARRPEAVADAMQRVLNDWYAQTGQLIRQFREEYGDAPAEPAEE